ncbi:CAAX protease self-immunity [Clostridium cavendishii DSM 21758]|uniref:CAAX protease self-immunity n=1 Tax=Clostridium cavendishii DSM 21758 TaxID=1121302 RepID=A0A1M6SLZ8_9CLOT|nr:type II CAAX endopeptidase family protein [Clostridium cavendishii]SHK45752.1 CAAX protease self-immunity [Clostridium cavendishii DSM 21758]
MLEVFEKTKIRWLLLFFVIINIVLAIPLVIYTIIYGDSLDGIMTDLIGFVSNLTIVIFVGIYYYKNKGDNKINFKFIKESGTKKEFILLTVFNLIFAFASVFLLQGIIHYVKPEMLKELLQESPIKSDSIIMAILVACIMAPVVEELVFRGIIFTRLRFRFNTTAAILISSLIFGLLHISLSIVHAFILGVTFCVIFKKYNNIFLNMILHSVYNFLATVVGGVLGLSFLNFDILTASDTSINICIAISLVLVILSGIYLFKFCKENWRARDFEDEIIELV